MNGDKTFEWCPRGPERMKTNEGIRPEKGVMLRFSLGLAWTAYLPVMTTAQTASLVMDSYLVELYHMYDNDSFLGSL